MSAVTAELLRIARLKRSAASGEALESTATSNHGGLELFENILQCPCCRESEYLHHGKIEVFERGEDAAHCLHTTIDSGVSTAISAGTGNPSRRRHGVSVELWCENCEVVSKLTLAQHKGCTVMKHFCIGTLRGSEL